MLNLFKLNINKKNKNKISDQEKKSLKHFPSSIREWNNSIYVYNKNALNLIPAATITAIKLINSYFSLYNFKLERKMRTKRLLLRLRRLSSNKIYVSDGEFKHTNNKVIITLYLFNRQKRNYILKIKKIYLKAFDQYQKKLNKRFSLIKYKGLQSLEKANYNKSFILKNLNKTNNVKFTKIKSYNSLSEYITKFYKKLVKKKSLRKLKLYFYYKQLLYINKAKLNYTYLRYLKKSLEKVYNKNVEFNLVNIKRFYLNSDILSESITLKLTRNRRKILKYLNKLKKKVKTQKKKVILHEFLLKKKKLNLKQNLTKNKFFLKKFVFNNLKYKHVTGFRLEASGRLTRRFTASKSISKFRYNGNLLNIDSSYKGLSSILLKGNLRSNLQYTKLKSKTRIGSFGIKGWVSGN